jgi:hypothetical protein
MWKLYRTISEKPVLGTMITSGTLEQCLERFMDDTAKVVDDVVLGDLCGHQEGWADDDGFTYRLRGNQED